MFRRSLGGCLGTSSHNGFKGFRGCTGVRLERFGVSLPACGIW